MPAFYGTVAAANTYHAERGNAAWAAGSDPNKEAALLRASTYVDALGVEMCDGQPVSKFPGTKTGGRTQVRSWPRTGATDIDGHAIPSDAVPIEVEHATYEAALRELAAPGSLSPDYTPGRQVKREKVDVLEVEYQTVAEGGEYGNPTRPVVPVVLELLAPVMISGNYYPGVTVV